MEIPFGRLAIGGPKTGLQPQALSLAQNDLVSWWKLNEAQGVRNDAAETTPRSTTFNGSSQYLSVADPFAPPTAFTVSVWVYPTTVAAGTRVVAGQGASAGNNLSWQLSISTATPRLVLSTDGTTSSVTATSGNVSANSWYLLTARWDGAEVTCYTNTTAGVAQPFAAAVFNSNATMNVGSNSTPANYFSGRIQNVAIWNDTDKGSSIVTDLYNSGNGLSYSQLSAAQKVGLTSFYSLDANADDAHNTNIWLDSHGSNHLTGTASPQMAVGLGNADAVSLNGTSQYLSRAAILGAAETTLTFSYWQFPTSVGTPRIIYGASTTGHSYISAGYVTNLPMFVWGNSLYAAASAAAVTNTWAHFVWVYNGGGATDADRLKLYVNGVLDTLSFVGGSVPASLDWSATTTVGGGQAASNWYYMQGRIQNLGVWNTNKDATFASEQYNSGRGLNYSELTTAQKTNLVSFWSLGHYDYTDQHGSNDLTATGSPGPIDGLRLPNLLTDNNTVLAGGAVGSYALALTPASLQYVEATALNTDITTKATVSLWIYTNTATTSDTVISLVDSVSGDAIELRADSVTATTAQIFCYDGNGQASVAGAWLSNQWRHHYIQYDGTQVANADKLKYWVDGAAQVLTFATNIPASLVLTSATLTVGINTAHTAGRYWPGRVQNLGIWSAIGQTTAAEQYNSGRGLRYSQLTAAQKVGMFDFWELGEASGNRVGSYAATALAPTNAPGRLAGIVNSDKTSTGANFVAANDESLSIVSNATLQTGNIDWAVWLWFNPTTLPAGAVTRGLYTKGSNAARESALFVGDFTTDANSIRFSLYDGTGGATVSTVKTASAPSQGEWNFVIAWHDASLSTSYIQMNDGAVVSAADTGTPATSAQAAYVGVVWGLATNDFDGAIDEVGLMKGRYPTAAERTYLYNNGLGRTYRNGKIL